MEDAWERRYALVELDLDTISDLLYPLFPGRHAVSAHLITEGKCNTNYRVIVFGVCDPVLLRLYVRDPSACARERNIHGMLQGHVPVPKSFYAGEMAETGGWSYAVFSWVEAVRLDHWLPSATPEDASKVAYDIGKAWAAKRGLEFDQPGFFDAGLNITIPFTDAVDGYLSHLEECLSRGNAGQRLGEALTDEIRQRVEENRYLLDGEKDARSLVHADFRPANMLVREGAGGWELAAVLDWEFAHSGSCIGDVGQLFRFEETLPPGFEDAFMRGAAEHGAPLPSDWKRMGRLFDLVHLCDLMDTEEERPVWSEVGRKLISASVMSFR